ncbi:MAG: YlxR family protein [Clostridia bacterium]|nr:YlxR family protein [Clostridia bacterium]
MGNKKVPMRMCIGCRDMKPKQELIRVVKSPEGDISLDLTGKKNGRGAYVCKNIECLKKIKKQKALNHTFGITVSETVYEDLEKEFLNFGE